MTWLVPRLMAPCRSCNARIVWATTTKGNRMPVDVEETVGGNVLLEFDPRTSKVTATVHDTNAVVMALGENQSVHVSHFVTCPGAKTHRRRR